MVILSAAVFAAVAAGVLFWASTVESPIASTLNSVTAMISPTAIMRSLPSFFSHTTPIHQSSQNTPTTTAVTTLEETEGADKSTSNDWWLNSGGTVTIAGDTLATIEGSLASNNPWRDAYRASNPVDTDNGARPQNVFRLIRRDQWGNVEVRMRFNIGAYDLSSSPNRNATNGVFLLARYSDGNNLYVAGIRVDGMAVIKRKLNGVYTTLGLTSLDNSSAYARNQNPNLLALHQWRGLDFTTINHDDGSVLLRLDYSPNGDTAWQTILSVTDFPKNVGGSILEYGSTGIRTDFMDVQFEKYMTSAPS